MLAALQQQRDDQVFLVIEVAQEIPAELHVRIVEPRQIGAERSAIAIFLGENDVGALDDATDRGVQRVVVALEQLETGRKPRLRPPEHGKVVEILDLVVLLEAAERPPQVVDQPGLQPLGA